MRLRLLADNSRMARRVITLNIDAGTGRALTADKSGPLSLTDILMTLHEQAVLRLLFWDTADGGQTWTAHAFTAGSAFVFGLKAPASITGTTFLHNPATEVWNDSGDWPDVSLATGKVCVRFDTITVDAETFLSNAADTPQDVILEVEVTPPGETPYTPAQFRGQLRNDVIRGTEGDPQPSQPTYVTLAQLQAVMGAGIAFQRVGNSAVLLINGIAVASWETPT